LPESAMALRDMGITIFAVGVGEANINELSVCLYVLGIYK